MATSRSSAAIHGASPDPKRHEGIQDEPVTSHRTGDGLANALIGPESQADPSSYAPMTALPLFPIPSSQLNVEAQMSSVMDSIQ